MRRRTDVRTRSVYVSANFRVELTVSPHEMECEPLAYVVMFRQNLVPGYVLTANLQLFCARGPQWMWSRKVTECGHTV